MTFDEKRLALAQYCASHRCAECALFGQFMSGVPCVSDDAYIESNYDKVFGGETFEHDGCKGCKFDSLDEREFPCRKCQGTCMPSSDEYNKRTDYYQPEKSAKEDAVDFVNSPPHYTQGGIECIDAMEAAFGAQELAVYCKIAAFKYIWRCEHKNGLEDVKKAVWYLNKHIELMERDGD